MPSGASGSRLGTYAPTWARAVPKRGSGRLDWAEQAAAWFSLVPLPSARPFRSEGRREDLMTDAIQTDAVGGQSVQLAVSNAMVRLYKEQFGRGPTRAKTNFAGSDVLITTLQDSMTPVERNLVALGEHQRLRDIRMLSQYAAEDESRGTVERLTGRKVWAFVSGIDSRQDVSIEVFYLVPLERDGASADGA